MRFNGNITEQYSLENLVNADILEKGKALFAQGFSIRPRDNKIAPAVPGKSFNVPWVYVCPDDSKDCGFWHQVIFDTYGLFPLGCLDCWKVVVRPKTVKQLFALHEYQDSEYKYSRTKNGTPAGYCKCGIELRKYVHGNYGGYFYNSSLEEGLQCYEKVRADITKYIGADISVTLKRACTEYELKYGDSSRWEELLEKGSYEDKDGNVITVPPLDVLKQKIEAIKLNVSMTAEDMQAEEGYNVQQPGYVKIHVMRSWLERAYDVGDPTALEFNEGGKLYYTPPVTYHNRTISPEEFERYKANIKMNDNTTACF